MFFKKKKAVQPQSDWNDVLNLDRFWLSQELEFQHQNEKHQFRASETNPLKLGRVIHSLFDIRKEEVALLTINDGSTLTNIETPDEIWDYNFLNIFIKKIENYELLDRPVIMSLFYREYEQKELDKDKSKSKKNGCLLIHLVNASGIREKVLYVQTTFCHPPIILERMKQGMFPQAKNISFLIGYDYRTETEITKEFDNVFNSAKNKVLEKRIDELTLLERDLLDLYLHPGIAKKYYFGERAMQENRFWDAIAYFENTFQGLQSQKWKSGEKLSDDEWKMFIQTSYLIGYCYYELGIFEKAYKYLELPYIVDNKNYGYFTEYVNCLERLQDVSTWQIIENRIQELSEKFPNNANEMDWELLLFCFRRKAYMLIDLEQYEEAKKYLEQILEIEPNNEFAKSELEYISKINEI